MSDGKPEEVKMSHLHALDRRISDHRLEVSESLNDAIRQIVTPMNELTTEIKIGNKNFAHLEKNYFSLEKRVEKAEAEVDANREKISTVDRELATVATTQGGILGVSGKVFPFVFAGLGLLITTLLSVSIYFKLSLGV